MEIHYFASIREAVGKEREQLTLPAGVASVADLVEHLSCENAAFAAISRQTSSVLVAVNQTVVDQSYRLSEDDEVAFFPPMTGG